MRGLLGAICVCDATDRGAGLAESSARETFGAMSLRDHRVIDCHGHIGRFEGYDLSLPTLLDNVDRHGVDLVLVSNIDGAAVPGRTLGLDQVEANRATVTAVRSHPGRLRGLLWGRPDEGEASELEVFLDETVPDSGWTERLFVGLKLHPEMNDVPADDPRTDPFLSFARRAQLPVVFHCDGQDDRASAERIARLAQRHPHVPVVLYHMGFNGPYESAIAAVETACESGSAELYLECSQTPADTVVEAARRVGTERLLFGTDATYYGRMHYEAYAPTVDALEKALTPEELDAVLFGNSARLFGLHPGPKDPPHAR